jgi:hypothetical protein
MTILNDNLRIILTFIDELKQVQVHAATTHSGLQLRNMGVVNGRGQLEDFLDKAGIDHYMIFSENPPDYTFKATAFERSPKQIADNEKNFRMADEIQLKRLNGDTLTDAEQSLIVPMSLTVSSASVRADEGQDRVQAWFNTKNV